jgi:hypothetical protein
MDSSNNLRQPSHHLAKQHPPTSNDDDIVLSELTNNRTSTANKQNQLTTAWVLAYCSDLGESMTLVGPTMG